MQRRMSEGDRSIPDSGTRNPIINHWRALANETDQPRISTEEPHNMKATNTTAAAPAPRATTPAQILAKSAGLSIKQVCKRAGIGERHFANLARNGQAGAYRAEILGHVCKCPDRVFLWGYETYLRHEAARARAGEAHSQPEVMTAGQSTVAAHRPRCYQRPTLRKI